MPIQRLMTSVSRFLQSEDGPTAVEYAVMLALILMSIIAAVSTVGSGTTDLWRNNSTQFSNAVSKAGS